MFGNKNKRTVAIVHGKPVKIDDVEPTAVTATTISNVWDGKGTCTDIRSIYYLPEHLVVKRSSEWRCKNCDCLNPLDKYNCHHCGAPKK